MSLTVFFHFVRFCWCTQQKLSIRDKWHYEALPTTSAQLVSCNYYSSIIDASFQQSFRGDSADEKFPASPMTISRAFRRHSFIIRISYLMILGAVDAIFLSWLFFFSFWCERYFSTVVSCESQRRASWACINGHRNVIETRNDYWLDRWRNSKARSLAPR